MRKVILFAFLAGALLLVYLAWPRRTSSALLVAPPAASIPGTTRPSQTIPPPAHAEEALGRQAESTSSGSDPAFTAPLAAPLATPAPVRAAALEAMHTAMVSYDPTKLPVITAYLNHPDEELRQAALENLLQMGEAAAAPLLRAASEKARSPQEALAMLDAADFLELPPAKLVIKSPAPVSDGPGAEPRSAWGVPPLARP